MNQPRRLERSVAFLIAVALAILGIATLALSWIPLPTLQSWLASAAFDGKADFLTTTRHQKLVVGLWCVGFSLIAAGGLLWIVRHWTALWLKSLFAGLGELAEDFSDAFRGIRARDEFWHWAALALIICMALGLRLFFIGLPIRYDEATTFMEYASKPVPVLLSYYSSPNNHIFHSLLIHISTWLFGDGLWAIRLPALLAGWLIVPASYLTFRLIYDMRVGLAAAALTAVCPVLVQFSVNARGYTLVTLFFVILLALMAYLRQKPNPAGWALVGLFSVLGFWTIPVMAFPMAAACLWWLLSPGPGQSIFSWRHARPLVFTMAATMLLTIALYVPVVLGSGWESLWSASGAATWDPIPHLILHALTVPWELAIRFWPDFLTIIFGGLLLIGFMAHWILPHRGVWIGFAVITGSCLVLLIFRSNPFERIWLFTIPAILGICAVGISWLSQRIDLLKRSNAAYGALMVALTIGLGLFTALSPGIPASEEGSTLRDAHEVTKSIAMHWRDGDAVLAACPVDEPLAYTFNRQGLPVAPVFALITGRLKEADRIWVVSKQSQGPLLTDLLKSAGSQIKEFQPPVEFKRFSEATIHLMEKATD